MAWMALLEGENGCDYSIGCGMRWVELKATGGYAEAQKELRDLVIGNPSGEYNCGFDGEFANRERRLTRATLINFTTLVSVPLERWYAEMEDGKRRREKDEQDASEREEYERLKAKFGNK